MIRYGVAKTAPNQGGAARAGCYRAGPCRTAAPNGRCANAARGRAPPRSVPTAPVPELVPPATPRPALTQVRRDALRLLVVMAGVGLLLLMINRSGAGLAIASSLDWAAFLVPPAVVAIGLDLLRRVGGDRPFIRFEELNGIAALFVAGLIFCGGRHHGGPLGNALADGLSSTLGPQGSPLAVAFLLALGSVLALHVTTRQLWRGLALGSRGCLGALRVTARFAGTGLAKLAQRRLPRAAGPQQLLLEERVLEGEVLPAGSELGPAPAAGRRERARKERAAPPSVDPEPRPTVQEHLLPAPDPAEPNAADPWALPAVAMLAAPVVELDAAPIDNSVRMKLIEDTLTSFNVNARVVGAHSGPTVTRFDVQPERGVRVARITALQNDLALSLAARTIRIQAPVPGQSVIGIEIPNAKTSLVTLREVLESDACTRMKSPLKIALGKDVSGSAVVADLARMPHLLIAGATGSGKSVCLNSLIACMLFHNSPERLRLLMIDPKMVELSVFNGVPHLLAPVVTDVTKVTGTLRWAIKEMHRRYKLFAECGARNLARYNELQQDTGKRLPFIVIIIDELADLMMVSPEDVEDSICRLAQLARATGMHLVLATQRPSVDVITGLIKANFPARIAFAVSSMVDSRTILDSPGAEKLLGRGDMLYQPADEGKAIRLQGTYLSDREIEEVVGFWKANPSREMEHIPASEMEPPAHEEESDSDDKLLNDAIRVLREYKRASVSLLQRRLSIGYTRAARLLDVLEDRGIVGPSEDGRSRVVLEFDDDGSTAESLGDDDSFPPL